MLCIGLDAGGTKTALLARTADGTTWSARSGGANLQRLGPERTAKRLAGLVLKACARFPEARPARLCAGVAGAGRVEDRQRLHEALLPLLAAQNFETVEVVPDVWIAHEGAFDGAGGVLVLAGTGSIVLARDRHGGFHRAGGWGYLLGDEGSGYAIGLAGLRAVAGAFDGGPATTLTARLARHHGITSPEQLIRRVYATRRREAFPPAVLRPGRARRRVRRRPPSPWRSCTPRPRPWPGRPPG
ncbi:MAG: hypothetical protein KatS3mg044_1160 [Rhodothermaceae bacterium]|nr:MAG: hypothetical protein KatS3mg044_1160 [Rhodothermaceae bacterium]